MAAVTLVDIPATHCTSDHTCFNAFGGLCMRTIACTDRCPCTFQQRAVPCWVRGCYDLYDIPSRSGKSRDPCAHVCLLSLLCIKRFWPEQKIRFLARKTHAKRLGTRVNLGVWKG